MSELSLTAENFEQEVLKSEIPVIVDFWAEWCAPCKMLHPVLDEISQEYAGKVKVAKLDVDENGEIAAQYNVVSIPTLLLFKDGTVANQFVGAAPKQTIEGFFKDYI
ncbi:MAG TPA: thioredoxin [Sediminispirochaeta sp.]|nr:thioredoxin [Sediminispirochaeta sp.]